MESLGLMLVTQAPLIIGGSTVLLYLLTFQKFSSHRT